MSTGQIKRRLILASLAVGLVLVALFYGLAVHGAMWLVEDLFPVAASSSPS